MQFVPIKFIKVLSTSSSQPTSVVLLPKDRVHIFYEAQGTADLKLVLHFTPHPWMLIYLELQEQKRT